jgi:nucleoredoxin
LLICLATPTQAGVISEQIQKNLVKLEGKKLKKYEDPELEYKKYFAFYFSAHWCPPCRAFTPKLVQSYNQLKEKSSAFELIFVSRDHSAEDMEAYAHEAQMPWPAIRFASIASKKGILAYMGGGIPSLVVVDADGKVLSDSYVDKEYRGPDPVVRELQQLLEAAAH